MSWSKIFFPENLNPYASALAIAESAIDNFLNIKVKTFKLSSKTLKT